MMEEPQVARSDVELAHGALIQDWPRLREWLEEDRPGLLTRESLRQATQEWVRHARDESFLVHQGARLDAARELAQRPHLGLNRLEQEYIRASVTQELADQRERAELAERARQESERRLETQRRFLGVVSALLVLVATFAVVTLVYKARAENERNVSLARALAAQALGEHERGDDERAALLARQAYLFDRDGAAREQIGTALQATVGTPFFSTIWRDAGLPPPPLSSLTIDPSGSFLAATSMNSRAVRIWDLRDASRAPMRLTCHGTAATAVAFSPRGKMLASGGATGSVILWDISKLDDAFADPTKVHDDGCGQALPSRLLPAGDPGNGEDARRGEVRAITFAVHSRGDGAEPEVWVVAGGCDRTEAFCAGGRGIVRVWDSAANDPPVVLEVPDQEVWSVAVNPAGDLLVAGTCAAVLARTGYCDAESMGRILAWEIAGEDLTGLRNVAARGLEEVLGAELLDGNAVEVAGHLGGVAALAFSQRDGRLASGGGDRTVRVWDPKAPDVAPAELRGHDAEVRALAFSPDGSWLLSGSQDETVRLWDMSRDAPERAIAVLGGSEEWIRGLAFAESADGDYLFAATSAGGTARVWRMPLPGGRLDQPALLRGHEGYVRGVAFAPDGAVLASAGEDGAVRFWGSGAAGLTPNPLPLDGLDAESVGSERWKITAVAYSPDGQYVAAGDDQSNVWLWPAAEPDARRVIGRHRDDARGVTALAFDPASGHLASGGMDGSVRLWDPEKGEGKSGIGPPLAVGNLPVRAVAWSADGSLLAAGGCRLAGVCTANSGFIAVWAMADASEFPATDTLLLRCDAGLNAAADGSPRDSHSLCGERGVASLVFTGGEQPVLVSGHTDGVIGLWQMSRQGDEVIIAAAGALGGHDGEVRALAVSAAGDLLASGSTDQTTRLWAVPPRGAGDAVSEIGRLPGRIFDMVLGREEPSPALAVIGGREEFVRALAFRPGTVDVLASPSADGTIRLSLAASDQLAAMVCAKVARNLDAEEWRRFVGGEIPPEATCPDLPVGEVDEATR